jgi:hypothetical protein
MSLRSFGRRCLFGSFAASLFVAGALRAQPATAPSAADGTATAAAASAPVAPSAAAATTPSTGAPPLPGASPHGASPHGASPSGAGGPPSAGRRMYQPPPDETFPDPSLPRGTLVAAIRDANDLPVAGATVELGIVHASVAQGDRREQRSATTDASGLARFEGLEVGTAHSYVVRSKRGEATYTAESAILPAQGGVVVGLHVFDASRRIEDTTLFSRSFVDVSVKDDHLIVEQRAELANASPVAWVADYEIPLPAGFSAFTAAEGMRPPVVATDRGARIFGTVPPGITSIGFRYHLPLETDGDQAFVASMPPHTATARVVTEASKKMGLDAEGFGKAERVADRTGKSFLVATRKWSPEQGGFIERFDVRITGLPERGWGAFLAAGLLLVAVAAGGAYAYQQRGATTLPVDSRDDLVEARDALLAEIEQLERAHQRGEVGPRSYARLRQALLDALARILALLDPEPSLAPAGAAGAEAAGPSAGETRAETTKKPRRKSVKSSSTPPGDEASASPRMSSPSSPEPNDHPDAEEER